MVKILFLGEIIGIPTIKEIQKNLGKIKEKYKIDFITANADGASDGYGILKNSAIQLYKSGIDILTCGDYVFNKKDVKELLKLPFLLRPYNLPNSMGGKGYIVHDLNDKIKIAVINIIGRTNFLKIFPIDPFHTITKILEKLDNLVKIIIVDFHGGTTSEIQAMHWFLAGKVSIIAGTHLRIITSDYRIINNKTAIITGCGFCGSKQSIGGLSPDIEIHKIKNGQFQYSKTNNENIQIQGLIADIDETSGNAVTVNLFKENLN